MWRCWLPKAGAFGGLEPTTTSLQCCRLVRSHRHAYCYDRSRVLLGEYGVGQRSHAKSL